MPAFVYPPSGLTHNFMRAMHNSYRAGVFQHDWAAEVGTRVGKARTLNGHTFLESDAEWIFQIDTDMLWEPGEIIKLRQYAEKHDIKAISGFTVVLKNGVWPHAYRYDGISYVPWGEIEPGTDPLKVDAVGSACFLVHRDVYMDVAEHTHEFTDYLWNEEEYNEDLGYHVGQDLSFANRINRFTDHEIWYHPGAYFLHMKLTPYGPKEYLRFIAGLRERVNGNLYSPNIQPASS